MKPDEHVWHGPGRVERCVAAIFNAIFRALEVVTFAGKAGKSDRG